MDTAPYDFILTKLLWDFGPLDEVAKQECEDEQLARHGIDREWFKDHNIPFCARWTDNWPYMLYLRFTEQAHAGLFKLYFPKVEMSEHTNVSYKRLRVAKALTGWMNGKKQSPLPDWDSLSSTIQQAYLAQADDAIRAYDEET